MNFWNLWEKHIQINTLHINLGGLITKLKTTLTEMLTMIIMIKLVSLLEQGSGSQESWVAYRVVIWQWALIFFSFSSMRVLSSSWFLTTQPDQLLSEHHLGTIQNWHARSHHFRITKLASTYTPSSYPRQNILCKVSLQGTHTGRIG